MEIFVKSNQLDNDTLIKEAKGLTLLQKTLESSHNNYIKIPKIIDVNKKYLKLQNIKQQVPTSSLMKTFAKGLAQLHKIEFENFGFYEDNYIGLNPQKNIMSNNWGDFFYEYRLLFQIKMITNESIKNELLIKIDSKRVNIISLLNDNTKHSSLVHGDIWFGNVIFDSMHVYLIDPAIYYGDREVDIAMTELFGGFTKEFYSTYNENFQLSKRYETKKVIYNLYHYLNHYNLFGNSYLSSVNNLLNQIMKI